MIHTATARRPRRSAGARCCLAALAAALVLPAGAETRALAQGWNPFAEPAPPGPPARRQPLRPSTADAPRPPLAPMEGTPPDIGQPHAGGAADGTSMDYDTPVGVFSPLERAESSDLPPLAPGEPAQPGGAGADVSALARLASEIEPTRSPALSRLLVRLLGRQGLIDDSSPMALGARVTALYRAGRVAEADEVASESAAAVAGGGAAGAVLTALRARTALAAGVRERACSEAQTLIQAGTELPATLKAEGIAIQGWCGAAAGNPSAAGLAAALGREQGSLSPALLAALEAVSLGEAPALGASGGRVGAIEWRLAELVGKLEPGTVALERLDAATLVAVATSNRAPPRLKLAAAEAAARINAIEPAKLAEIYRQQPFTAGDLAQVQTTGARVEGWSRRALLFRAAEVERTPFKRTRLVRTALDDARRAGLYLATAAAFTRAVEEIRPVAEVGWFAETAVEVMLAAGQLEGARRWARLGTEASVTADRAAQSLAHWLALIDIADPAQRAGRGASLASVEDIALRGRYTPEGLHRLATVLDALDYHVPMRLWEAASRAPQPTSGHLPPTGLLSELKEAAKGREIARTVALSLRALGPDGPEGAHMIALGDVIRALKRVGLEPEARSIAVESLFGLWPRGSSS